MAILDPGKKMTVRSLIADKKLLNKFASPFFIKNRKTGKVTIIQKHSFEDTIYLAKNADNTDAIYVLEELSK